MNLKWIANNIDYNTSPNNQAAITAKIQKAEASIPDSFKEAGSRGMLRLNVTKIREAKGEPVYRFDNMNVLYIVEKQGMYGIDTKLFYVTSSTGAGNIEGVLISNTDANTYMYSSNGEFVSGSDTYNFFRVLIKDGGKRKKHTRKHRKQRKAKSTRKH